jgi:hypothetical protein
MKSLFGIISAGQQRSHTLSSKLLNSRTPTAVSAFIRNQVAFMFYLYKQINLIKFVDYLPKIIQQH